MKKQTTYNNENEIIAAIEEAQAKSENFLKQSVEIEAKALEMIRFGNQEEVEKGKEMLKEAGEKDRAAQRVTLELKKLKDALSAFRTMLIPGVIPKGENQERVVI